MPYDSPSDAPTYVPEPKRAQWISVFNSAYKKAISEGKDQKDAEASAFRQANGVSLTLSDIPPHVPRIPSQLAVYVELPGAVKDGECLTVEVQGGISMQHGCCNLWAGIEGESAASFQCGTCRYHIHPEHSEHLMATQGKFARLFTYELAGNATTKRIPLAYTGTFVKGGDKFSITASDLQTIVKNFSKKANGEINLDYEHASEMPEVAKGGPVLSAGAFKNLSVEPGPDGTPWLFGEPNYTELAKSLIEKKEYRYLSPAIDWSAEDKSTGDPVGATLTTVALTNRPFLEKLPPLLMTEVPKLLTEETTMTPEQKETVKKLAEAVKAKEEADKKAKLLAEGGEKPGKGQLRMRQVTDSGGTHIHVHAPAGGDGEAAFGELMGEIYPADWKAMTAAAAPPPDTTHAEPDGDEAMAEKVGQALGAASPVTMTDVKKFYDAGKEAIRMTDANQGFKLLSETVSDKGFDRRKSLTLLSEGKVSPQQFAAFEVATELVELGVKEGKIHPAQRTYFLSDAMNRPKEFEAYIAAAKPYIILTEKGLPGTSPTGATTLTEAERTRTEALEFKQKEEAAGRKCNMSRAIKEVHKRNPDRAVKMREEATRTTRVM